MALSEILSYLLQDSYIQLPHDIGNYRGPYIASSARLRVEPNSDPWAIHSKPTSLYTQTPGRIQKVDPPIPDSNTPYGVDYRTPSDGSTL